MMSPQSRPGVSVEPCSAVAVRPRVRLRAVLLAVACLAGVLGLWGVFVLTCVGQRLEAAALEGSRIGSHYVSDQARALLSTVSMPAAVLLVVVILLVGWLRRSHRRAAWAVVAVVGANLSTQVVKQWILWRPDYSITVRWDNANTLPSGHTTMAASAAVALVLLSGARWRAAAAWAGAVGTAAMGYSTLVAQWHRPADVLAAVLLTVAWGAVAVAAGAWADDAAAPPHQVPPGQVPSEEGPARTCSGPRRAVISGPAEQAPPPPRSGPCPAGRRLADEGGRGARRHGAQRLWCVLLCAAGAVLCAVAMFLEAWVWSRDEPMARWDYFAAYTAGSVGTVAVSALALGLLACLTTWTAPRPRPEPTASDDVLQDG